MTKHDLKSVLGHSHRHTTITHITMDDSKQSLAMSSPVQVEEEIVMQVAEEEVSTLAHQFELPSFAADPFLSDSWRDGQVRPP